MRKVKRVSVGLQDRNVAEIKSGLNEGDVVVIGQAARSDQKQKSFSFGTPKFK